MLRSNAGHLVAEALRSGTTTMECKSGYGLTVDDEVRCLEVAGEFTDEVTFLGAHVVPPEYASHPDDYVELVRTAMLDACAPKAKWVDVFCERGAFDGDQARAILAAGMERGLQPRIHANQLGPGPGVQIAVEVGAASADHATHLDDADVEALAAGSTVATLLPAAEFSTRAAYPDARRLLDAGVTVALAADCNPRSSFTSSMPFCIAIAVRDMHMTQTRRYGRRPWAAPAPCDAPTSGTSASAHGPTPCSSTPPPTSTCPTGQESSSSPTYGRPGGSHRQGRRARPGSPADERDHRRFLRSRSAPAVVRLLGERNVAV